MKKLSHWAKCNPVKARIGIALSYLVLFFLSISLGLLLFFEDLYVSPQGFYLASGLFFLCYLLYPIKGLQWGVFQYSYWRQKRMDFLLVFLAFTALSIRFNTFIWSSDAMTHSSPRAVFTTIYANPEAAQTHAPTSFTKQLKSTLKELKAEAKVLKQQYKADPSNTGVKILLILALTLGIVLLLYLIAVWSCSLSCSGQEGAAALVVIGGLALIIWLSIIAVRGILHLGKKNETPAVEKNNS